MTIQKERITQNKEIAMNSTDSDRGFSLLEMMVSIFILALVLISIFKMQSGTIRLSASGNFYSTSSHLARQKLTDLTRKLRENSFEDHASGDFGENFSDYRWRCIIEIPELYKLQLHENMAVTVENMMGEHLMKRFRKIELEILHVSGQTFQISTWRFLQNTRNNE